MILIRDREAIWLKYFRAYVNVLGSKISKQSFFYSNMNAGCWTENQEFFRQTDEALKTELE